ncbi:XRE family transcriptional regulator [uncultured Duncaniella sp.]|jgi:phage repressor protein C with HTH and peptisase S24 domain|uniref:XRE family transcriptional regulator n=3 Tax=uncultured Duncaniella sp. TaxID=2768039 RepID=UPI000F485A40|nr:XRE family transcriptional regulator [uncultured Duncaniella sp.]ROS88574.1 LexA family transcriptional regulator [Muribaculaceae bacterium Isolate-080 (Janvier)]
MLDPDTMDRCAADGKSSNGSLRGVVGISVDDVSVAESAGGESAQVSRIDSEAIIGRVRYLMGLKRLSQRRLAALLRIDASNLSKVLNGKLPFSEGLVNRIVADLGVSKPWLRDGMGLPFDKQPIAKEISPDDMPVEEKSLHATPVYDLDVTAGCSSLDALFGEIRPIGAIDIPGIPPGCHILKVRGDSMMPRIVNGGYVAIRKISDMRNIFWGQIYVVDLPEFRMVKYLRRHPDPSMVILHSDNPAYDDMDVARSDIRSLYVVEAIINYEIN